jgi:hypothetical protein
MKIRPVRAEVFLPEGECDEANSHFSQFYERAQKYFPVPEDSKLVTKCAISPELSLVQSVSIVKLCACDTK